jgi:hypothetical protein
MTHHQGLRENFRLILQEYAGVHLLGLEKRGKVTQTLILSEIQMLNCWHVWHFENVSPRRTNPLGG